jgi:hypothetical protein
MLQNPLELMPPESGRMDIDLKIASRFIHGKIADGSKPRNGVLPATAQGETYLIPNGNHASGSSVYI